MGEACFWRIDSKADYGVLDKLARARVNTELITNNWNNLLHLAGSLKLGYVNASKLMETLLESSG